MRRYGSFLVRWWQSGPEERRLRIRHIQSDEELTVEALADALAWMTARVAGAERAPPPCADGEARADGTPPDVQVRHAEA